MIHIAPQFSDPHRHQSRGKGAEIRHAVGQCQNIFAVFVDHMPRSILAYTRRTLAEAHDLIVCRRNNSGTRAVDKAPSIVEAHREKPFGQRIDSFIPRFDHIGTRPVHDAPLSLCHDIGKAVLIKRTHIVVLRRNDFFSRGIDIASL